MGNAMDLKASGSLTVAGGIYGEVKTSASLKVNGNLKCESLKNSGSTHVHGNMDCGDKVSCSGSLHIDGNFQSEDLSISGSTHIGGSLTVGERISASGSVRVGGDLSGQKGRFSGSCDAAGIIRVQDLKVSGSLRAKEVESEVFVSSGSLFIEGLLNAETMEIHVGGGNVGDLGGSLIRVLDHRKTECKFGIPLSAMFSKPALLTVGTVEGDQVEVDCLQAQVVRGRTVEIGANCRIERVEYSERLTVAEGARIGQQVKIWP